jgi:hypothetical protein
MAAPTLSDVHISRPLTNLVIHYGIPNMVASRVFPKIKVDNEVDRFYKYTSLEELISYTTLRAPGDPANEMEFAPTNDTYSCEEHALKMPLPKRVVANADAPTELEKNTVKKITRALTIAYERRVQALAQSTAQVDNNFAATTAWNTASGGGTVEQDVQAAKEYVRNACGAEPNAILLSSQVADDVLRWLKVNAFTEFDKWVQTGMLPPILWDLETIVAKGVYNTQPKGVAASLAAIWSNNVLVFYKSDTPSTEALSFGYSLMNQDFKVKSWYSNDRNSTFYEVSHIVDEKVAASGAGCIITGAHP